MVKPEDEATKPEGDAAATVTAGFLEMEEEKKEVKADGATNPESPISVVPQIAVDPKDGPKTDEEVRKVVVGAEEEMKSSVVDTAEEAAALSPPPSPVKPRKVVRGILKQSSIVIKSKADLALTDKSKDGAKGEDGRRHMFPSYAPPIPEPKRVSNRAKNSISFAPMARVVTVASRRDLTYITKTQIWWQKTDYEDFKKTGRIIAMAMLAGGSEIWLKSNDAWERRKAQQKKDQLTNDGGKDDGLGDDEKEYARALRQYGGTGQKPGEAPRQETEREAFRSKWWCKFGHSRRGLEHIASVEEGRQRQRNVSTAIRAIVDEQRRQRMYGSRDPVKLSRVAFSYTSWARDLALAAAAADAEVVKSNFNATAKSRTHYLLHGVDHKNGVSTSAGENTGSLSQGGKFSFVSANHIAPEVLDANAHSVLGKSLAGARGRSKSPSTMNKGTKNGAKKVASNTTAAAATTIPPSFKLPPPAKGVQEEAIHDPNASSHDITVKAAGFNCNKAKIDMSAVLTGMGSVPRQ